MAGSTEQRRLATLAHQIRNRAEALALDVHQNLVDLAMWAHEKKTSCRDERTAERFGSLEEKCLEAIARLEKFAPPPEGDEIISQAIEELRRRGYTVHEPASVERAKLPRCQCDECIARAMAMGAQPKV